MEPQGKVALVTGAGSGIGKAVALAFLHEGYRVTLAGRRPEPLTQAVNESGVPGRQALIVPTDVRDPAAVRAAGLHYEGVGRAALPPGASVSPGGVREGAAAGPRFEGAPAELAR